VLGLSRRCARVQRHRASSPVDHIPVDNIR
jgi:hypothetical protein